MKDETSESAALFGALGAIIAWLLGKRGFC